MASDEKLKRPKSLWILMYRGFDRWFPAMDHFCAWNTKKAALWKIKQLGVKGKNYRPFKYRADPH